MQSWIFGFGIQHTDQFPWPWGDASSYRQHCIHHPRRPLTHPAASGHHPPSLRWNNDSHFPAHQQSPGKPGEAPRTCQNAHYTARSSPSTGFRSSLFHPNNKWASNFWEKCSLLWIGEFELDEESGVMPRVIGAICSMGWHVRMAGGEVRGGGGRGSTLTFHEAEYGTRKKKLINSKVKKGREKADYVRIARVER